MANDFLDEMSEVAEELLDDEEFGYDKVYLIRLTDTDNSEQWKKPTRGDPLTYSLFARGFGTNPSRYKDSRVSKAEGVLYVDARRAKDAAGEIVSININKLKDKIKVDDTVYSIVEVVPYPNDAQVVFSEVYYKAGA